MTRAPRLALYVLLVLMQIIAPWVHAHTGAETGGFLHLPGLEFLAKGGEDWGAAGTPPGGTDVIVSVPAGVWDGAGAAGFSPDNPDPPYLPAAAPPFSPQPVAGCPRYIEAPPPLFHLSRHDANPRAPPLHSSNP